MKITVPDNLNANDFPDENDNFYRLLGYFVQHRYETVQLSRNNITFEDNAYIQLIDYKFNHGEKAVFPNTLKSNPRGIIPIFSSKHAIDSCTIQLETNAKLGITVNFADSPTFFHLKRNSNQAIADATTTAIIWDSSYTRNGSGLNWDSGTNPTRVTCVTPGYYEFSYTVSFASNATGKRTCFFAKNGVIAAPPLYSFISDSAAQTDIHSISSSVIIKLDVNDYVECYCYQNSTASLDVIGNSTAEVQLVAKNIEYAPQQIRCLLYVLG